MWRISGLFRDVTLIFVPSARIDDVFARAEFNADFSKAKLLIDADVYCANGLELNDADLLAELIDKDGKTVASGNFAVVGIDEGETISVKMTENIDNPHLWSSEDPYLYKLRLTFTSTEKGVKTFHDMRQIDFGFRQVEIVPSINGKQPYIKLNGKKLKIRGVNRHEFHPDFGHAVPREYTEKDILLLKSTTSTPSARRIIPTAVISTSFATNTASWSCAKTTLKLTVWQRAFPARTRDGQSKCAGV